MTLAVMYSIFVIVLLSVFHQSEFSVKCSILVGSWLRRNALDMCWKDTTGVAIECVRQQKKQRQMR